MALKFARSSVEVAVERFRRDSDALGATPTTRTESELVRDDDRFVTLLNVAYELSKQKPHQAIVLADEMLRQAQWSVSSSAASSLNQLAARQASNSDQLAQLVRERQDLVAEWQMRDKALMA